MLTPEEVEDVMVRLADLGGLLEALTVLHGVEFPEISERYIGLLTRLDESPSEVEMLDVRQFIDTAIATIMPVMKDLPEYSAALERWLSDWEGHGPAV